MNKKKIKLSALLVSTATMISLGVGLGVGLSDNRGGSSESSPAVPVVPGDNVVHELDFSRIDINSRIGEALAVNINSIDIENFSSLAYVKDATISVIDLRTSTQFISYYISTGRSAIISNGFAQNGHLYLPVERSTVSEVNYMELETTESNSGVIKYIYLDGLGSFDGDGSFQRNFTSHFLTNYSPFKLFLSVDGTPNSVPIPQTANTTSLDFQTSDLGDNDGSVLNTQLTSNVDISRFSWLDKKSTESIEFQNSVIIGGSLTLILKTETDTPNIFFNLGVFYAPIEPLSINSNTYNYVVLKTKVINSVFYFYFASLAENINENDNTTLFQQLTNTLSVTLEFALSN